ncbi:hypothetical protein JCM3775_005878 [Rhodotorula graminis]|uniref:Oxidoreductase n=1 Tax=Rhodotorula graminis (strain WP1) TaxID=578459 RepID=A0A194S4R8_RHOGW|nr:uncharacterized protein RHOBADRAFT_54245 [Rhodotorula graminis WP1]KPV74416.1 hypothetical protein RHOBADRAFT_54245 [Rhodotorula graminis WP1]
MAPTKIAVVGFGMSATVFHIPFILSLPDKFELKVVVERSATPDKSKARDKYPHFGLTVVNTLAEALEQDIDAVWVLAPNAEHFAYCKQALEAGKHVVVEKPVTPTSHEAFELADLARAKGRVLAVYQNRRWDADFLTLKQLVDKGEFGELSEFESSFDRYKNVLNAKQWKEADIPGAGAAYDLGSHVIDQIVDLFGAPQRITGLVRNSRQIGVPTVPDSFHIQLHYDPVPSKPGRALPLLATARGSILSLESPQPRFRVRGTGASFVKTGVDAQEAQLVAGGPDAIGQEGFAVEPSEQSGILYRAGVEPETITSVPGSYASWFSNVGDALLANDPSQLIVKPEQAALVIKVIEVATQSSREGRTLDFSA